MRIEIVGHNVSGTCSLSGKKETEVFAVQIDGGDVQQVSTQRLPEILRMLCSIGGNESESTRPRSPPAKS